MSGCILYVLDIVKASLVVDNLVLHVLFVLRKLSEVEIGSL